MALPHWPAPVSDAIRFVPSSLLKNAWAIAVLGFFIKVLLVRARYEQKPYRLIFLVT